MSIDSEQTEWTVGGLLDLFDVVPGGADRFVGQTGIAGVDERQVVEGTQVMAQAIVAAASAFRRSRCGRRTRCSRVPWSSGRRSS